MNQDFQLEIDKGIQSLPKSNSTLSNIDELQLWLDNLPMASIGSMTQLFYERLRQLNATEMAPDTRFNHMEALRESHRHLRIGLTEKYSGIRFPLSEKKQQVAEINREMIHQMAIGYKIIIQDHASATIEVSTQLLVNAIGRAISYLGSSLLESYRIYTSVREMTWFELHSLYRYAQLKQIQTQSLTDNLLDDDNTITIESLYMQLLIVAAIDPYRLPRGESDTIFAEMGSWVQHLKLSPIHPKNQPVGIYLVKLDRDMPPIHMSSHLSQAEGDFLYLDCSQLAEEIGKRTSTDEQNSFFPWRKPKSDISKDALNSLVIALGAVGERLLRRTRTHAQISVVVGLTNIHQELSSTRKSDNLALKVRQKQKPIFETHDLPSLTERADSKADVWSFSPSTTRIKTTDPLYVDFPTSLKEPVIHEVEKIHLKVVDISSGGYCLEADSGLSNKVQVGDLLALRETENARFSWKVGSIQWIRQEKDEGLTLGVRVLHANPVPVLVKASREGINYSLFDKALLLPAVPTCNKKPALLTDVIPFKTGMPIQMHDEENVVHLVLGKLIAATKFFVLHEYGSKDEAEINPFAATLFDEAQLSDLLSSL